MSTTWTCDVCKVASFLTYDDAVKHEEQCNGVPPPPGSATTSISTTSSSNNQQMQSQQQLVQQQMSRSMNHAVPNSNGGHHQNHIMNSVASNNTATSAPASRGSGTMPHILPHTNMMIASHQQDAKAPPQQQQASQNIGKSSVAVEISAIYENTANVALLLLRTMMVLSHSSP